MIRCACNSEPTLLTKANELNENQGVECSVMSVLGSLLAALLDFRLNDKNQGVERSPPLPNVLGCQLADQPILGAFETKGRMFSVSAECSQ